MNTISNGRPSNGSRIGALVVVQTEASFGVQMVFFGGMSLSSKLKIRNGITKRRKKTKTMTSVRDPLF